MRTKPRTQATAQKIGKDRLCGSGDILTDRQTDTHRETYSSQYFAATPTGKVMNAVSTKRDLREPG